MDLEHLDPSDWSEWRRMRAWHLRQGGWQQRDIAAALGVTEAAVSQGMAPARREGPTARLSRPAPGHPAQRLPEPRRLIPDHRGPGAAASGFRGAVGTGARVATVIAAECGVSSPKGPVARRLRDRGGTPPMPIARAIPRDEPEIERGRGEVWPRLKAETRRQRRGRGFVDEAGFSRRPGRVRTDAPRGRTPVLHEGPTRDHLSVMGGVTTQGRISVLVRQEPLNGRPTIEFLKHLIRPVGPRRLVVWDGSPIHRRAEVKQFPANAAGRGVRVEPLPPDAPDLNPVEGAWPQWKHVERRNLVCRDREELHLELHLAIGRRRQKAHLIQSFFKAAGLALENLLSVALIA